jgi:hypothetical protein
MLTRKTGDELRAGLERMRTLYREAVVHPPIEMATVVRGIFLGGCVKRGVGSSFRHQAHAHNEPSDKHFNWICVRSIKRLGEYTLLPGDDGLTHVMITKPSRLLWHEFAHLLCPGHGHDDTWRRKMRELKQPLPAHYRKRKVGRSH